MSQSLSSEKIMDSMSQLKVADHLAKQGYVRQWALDHPTTVGVARLNHKPHMPCYQLCSYINRPEKMWRPHITCLFCLPRRWHYGKLNRDHWILLRPVGEYATRYYLMGVTPKHGSYTHPAARQIYFIFLNTMTKTAKLRDAIIRCLMQLVEKVNNYFCTTKKTGVLKKAMVVNMEAASYGTVLPLGYKAYFIVYNRTADPLYRVRNMIIRPLTTICELIGQM